MKNSFKIPVYTKKNGRRVVQEEIVEATYIPISEWGHLRKLHIVHATPKFDGANDLIIYKDDKGELFYTLSFRQRV